MDTDSHEDGSGHATTAFGWAMLPGTLFNLLSYVFPQIVSSLCQSPCAWIPSLISRLVETAGEQHEETQAYVTDLLVCLLNSASTLSGVLPEVPPLPCASPTHTRSTSYTPALLRQSMINQKIQNDRKDARLSLLVAEEQPWTAAALVRSKSADQLKSDTDSDEEATARVQMVAIAVALLESNLENEFLLALSLLEKVIPLHLWSEALVMIYYRADNARRAFMTAVSDSNEGPQVADEMIDKDSRKRIIEEIQILSTAGVHKVPCVQKLEKTIQQLEWKGFQNIVSLVVRGAFREGCPHRAVSPCHVAVPHGDTISTFDQRDFHTLRCKFRHVDSSRRLADLLI